MSRLICGRINQLCHVYRPNARPCAKIQYSRTVVVGNNRHSVQCASASNLEDFVVHVHAIHLELEAPLELIEGNTKPQITRSPHRTETCRDQAASHGILARFR